MEEFTEISSIGEMFRYMRKKNRVDIKYMNELDTIGYDRTEQPTKIIYEYENGETDIITESGTISLDILFEEYYKGN